MQCEQMTAFSRDKRNDLPLGTFNKQQQTHQYSTGRDVSLYSEPFALCCGPGTNKHLLSQISTAHWMMRPLPSRHTIYEGGPDNLNVAPQVTTLFDSSNATGRAAMRYGQPGRQQTKFYSWISRGARLICPSGVRPW